MSQRREYRHRIITGDTSEVISLVERNGFYEFPCGCKFAVDPEAKVNSRLPVIIPRDMPDCPHTWGLIGAGMTVGVFQLESHLGRRYARKALPTSIEHLAAVLAAIRPGCLNARDENGVNMADTYCMRKNGAIESWETIEAIRDVMEPTYGVMLYQESAMSIAQRIANFNLVEVDRLRKCVTGDTMFVSRTRGWISIDRLLKEGYVDDEFLIMDEAGSQSWQQLENIWSTGKHNVRRVETSSGHAVRATQYHQFLTDSGWKARMRMVPDSDFVVAARSVEYEGVDRISEDMAFVIAGIVAEGSFRISKTGSKHSTFVNHDMEMMDWFRRAYSNCFGEDNYWISDDENVIAMRVAEQKMLEPYINRGKSDSRRLPDVMMGMTKESTRKWLSFLLACEGGLTEKTGQFEFSSKSPTLPMQVKLLLLRYGIRSNLIVSPDGDRHRLYITTLADQKLLLEELTDFWPKVKRDGLRCRIEKFQGVTTNFTTDVFPNTITKRMIDQYPYVASYEGGSVYKSSISREKFQRLANGTGDSYWNDLGDSGHWYDKLKSTNEQSKQVETYDFTVAGGKTPYIIANGLVIHNSMGKKDVEEMSKVGKLFVDKAEAFGVVSREDAQAIFDNIKKSGRYLFNASHAFAYAYNSYETAYLKCHFPVWFYAANLMWADGAIDPLEETAKLIGDARRFDIDVKTPRFSDLEPNFTTDDQSIRFGLTNVKGVGEKAVAKLREKLGGIRHGHEAWGWWDFLTLGSSACGATVVRNLIRAGAMDEYNVPRQRMIAEFEAWASLTEKEREKILSLGEPLYKHEPVYEIREEIVEGKVGKNGKVGKPRVKKTKVRVSDANVLVDEARPVDNLENALTALLNRPGAITKGRVDKVNATLRLLQNPPSPLVDTPYLVMKNEEELLGVPITTSPVENVDTSIVNTTIREYLDGKTTRDLMVIAVEVTQCVEREIRNGTLAGRKMASLIVTDGEDILDEVVVFPDAWEEYGLLLMRPRAVVALGGKRSYRDDGKTFIVEKVWGLS